MFEKSYTFGRFNIPHKGHLHLLEEMRKISPTVVVGVSTGQRNAPIELRVHLLSVLAPWATFIETNSIFSLPTEEDVLVFGEDQEKLAAAISKHSGAPFQVVKRDASAPSSTKCREAFKRGDLKAIRALIPERAINWDLFLHE